jgi:hypothetical protein
VNRYSFAKWMGPISAPIALAVAAMLLASVHVKADEDDHESHDSRIRRGLEAAPVPLNMRGKDRELVGLGSYLVNVAAECNGCHSAGPASEYARGGNPYFGQPAVVNQATYLGGGRDFGPLIPGTPNIISRNLTPDRTGRPAGGLSFAEFHHILRTGEDLDHLHPKCSEFVSQNCLPAPFDGDLLQIMPWPAYQNMATSDIRAIYEYLRAVPCIEGPPAPSVLHNDCY